jgi:transcriptional regulator with XRE-family HTH domain
VTYAPRLDDQLLDDIAYFGLWIKRLRRGFGLSQAQLAERCGCSQSTISRLEAGLVPLMPLARVVLIFVALEAFPTGRVPRRAPVPAAIPRREWSEAEAEQLLRALMG